MQNLKKLFSSGGFFVFCFLFLEYKYKLPTAASLCSKVSGPTKNQYQTPHKSQPLSDLFCLALIPPPPLNFFSSSPLKFFSQKGGGSSGQEQLFSPLSFTVFSYDICISICVVVVDMNTKV